MSQCEVGARVGAVRSADAGTVWLYGYGVYEGRFLRPAGTPGALGPTVDPEVEVAELMGHLRRECEGTGAAYDEAEARRMAEEVLANPRIRLDSGKVVWGCQCWWGPEAQIRRMAACRRVVDVDIDADAAGARG